MTEAAAVAQSRPEPPAADRPKPWQRLAGFGLPPRIIGLDIARGLAIIGMIAAHVAGIDSDFDWGTPSSWAAIVHGNPSILFALLAGVSIGLMTGRTHPPAGTELVSARMQLVARGTVIFGIGVLLEQLGTNIAVILTFYAVLYVIALPFLRARRRTLILWAAGLALLGPALQSALQSLTMDAFGSGSQLLLHGTYSLPVWASLMLAGLAIGRSDLTRARFAAGLVVVGAVLSAVGFGAGTLYAQSSDASFGWVDGVPSVSASSAVEPYEPAVAVVPGEDVDLTGFECEADAAWVNCWPAGTNDSDDDWSLEDDDSGDNSYSAWPEYLRTLAHAFTLDQFADALLASSPHSGGTAEVLGSGGLGMAVVGLLLLVGQWLRWPLLPVATLGAMPLTAYTAHVVWVYALVGPGGMIASATVFWLMAGSLALLCLVWTALFGRGPLERLTRWVGIRLTR